MHSTRFTEAHKRYLRNDECTRRLCADSVPATLHNYYSNDHTKLTTTKTTNRIYAVHVAVAIALGIFFISADSIKTAYLLSFSIFSSFILNLMLVFSLFAQCVRTVSGKIAIIEYMGKNQFVFFLSRIFYCSRLS